MIRTCFAPILQKLDDRLAVKLDEAAKVQDAAAGAKLATEAQAIIQEYVAFVDSSPLVKHLDDNPYKPVKVRKTLDAALAALTRMVQVKAKSAATGMRA